MATLRVGSGMAKGLTSFCFSSDSCSSANSGTKVSPFPLSTIRISVSILPSLHEDLFIITFSTDNDPLLMPVADRPLHADETAKNYILNIIADGTSLVADKMQFSDQNKANPVPFAAEQTVKNLLELLFLRLLRQNTADPDPQSSAQPSTDNALVLSVLKIIEKNICEKISLDFIAKQVGYSVSRISSVFKTYTGMSVIDYYIRQRIRKAQELIFENKHSFQEISDAMNFDSVQYFSWQFKKITGMSPSQYRNITKSGASFYDVRLGKL